MASRWAMGPNSWVFVLTRTKPIALLLSPAPEFSLRIFFFIKKTVGHTKKYRQPKKDEPSEDTPMAHALILLTILL
jgi:hypothetical protein